MGRCEALYLLYECEKTMRARVATSTKIVVLLLCSCVCAMCHQRRNASVFMINTLKVRDWFPTYSITIRKHQEFLFMLIDQPLYLQKVFTFPYKHNICLLCLFTHKHCHKWLILCHPLPHI